MKNAIETSTLTYLKKLAKNNNRVWFTENKPSYEKERAHMIQFADALLNEMNKIDHIETPTGKKSLLRIYRDIRFSKDKTPYKSHFGGGLRRATKRLRGGYYYHIQPGHSFVAGGFWGPNSADVKRIRAEIDQDPKAFRKIFAQKNFKTSFGSLVGQQLKSAPRGFKVDHPDIDLLRYKQFVVRRDFTDKEIKDPSFLKEVVKTYKHMRPFFDLMSDVLTTDLNGISII